MSNGAGNLVRMWLNGGGNWMREWGVGGLLEGRGRNGFGCGGTSVEQRIQAQDKQTFVHLFLRKRKQSCAEFRNIGSDHAPLEFCEGGGRERKIC